MRALLALLTALVGCTPRHAPTATDPGGEIPAALAQLDGWVAAREAAFPDITPGAEKHIRWADPDAPARTPVSIVYLHGYSATRQEVDPLCQRLAARLGANLFLTRLTGHGRGGDPMAAATVPAWLDDAQEAMAIGRRLGERVVVIGTSTGGTLLAWLLAAGGGDDAAAAIYISPNFGPQAAGSSLLLWPGRRALMRLILGTHREWEPANEEQARYWTWRYPTAALFPMAELVKMVEAVDLSAAPTPTMMIWSPDDEVIRPELAQERFDEITAAPRRRLLITGADDPSNHVIAGRICSPNKTEEITEAITRFLVDEVGLPVSTSGEAAGG
jgi:esterase/lipase